MFHGRKPQQFVTIPVAVMAAAIAMVVAGCASAPPVQETKMVWPPPPLPARIKFVRTITSEKDLSGRGDVLARTSRRS